MASAKDIKLKPIPRGRANPLVKELHYSGKIVPNTQLHIGVFLHGELEGAMQFGPPMDKRKVISLVAGTEWNGMMELNRMAFSDNLPRNSESRAISVAMTLMKKHAPHVEWVLSFADATQCGDGAIYRAAGFVLTGIKENDQVVEFPDGRREARLTLTDARRPKRVRLANEYDIDAGSGSSLKPFLQAGCEIVPGYQLRYIYFINDDARDRLTVPEIPYDKIDEVGAGMYRGEKVSYEERNQAPEA